MFDPEQPIGLPVEPGRSGCPINMTVELLGDRWSFIVLRDIMFGQRRHFRELLVNSLEGIASNILSARLDRLVRSGLLTRHDDPTHRQKIEYRLTEAAIELVPVFVALGDWGTRWLPTSADMSARARHLSTGGEDMQRQWMNELRAEHVEGLLLSSTACPASSPPPTGPSRTPTPRGSNEYH